MKKHAFDPLSFIFGVAFLVLAGGLSFESLNLTGALLRWTAAGTLLLLGVVMLLTSGRNRAKDPS